MVTFLGMVTRDHDHREMKTMTVLEIVTILGKVTVVGMLAIIEYVWLRYMTLHVNLTSLQANWNRQTGRQADRQADRQTDGQNHVLSQADTLTKKSLS